MKNPDEKFMAQALRLARLGGQAVAPNPMVGAVIVKNGKVVGEGYHERFGGPHAEVNAIYSVGEAEDLRGATIYVTLEPCRHYGKTPPCSEAIRIAGIIRVVVGSRDLFQTGPLPKGYTMMRGKIAKECKELNKFFFNWVGKKRPFITVKVAMSADGFVAGAEGKPVRFTTPAQDREVHRLRASHQAIMVGINTVLNDDPRLNVRHVNGTDPLRVVVDSKMRIPEGAKVLKGGNYLIATTIKASLNREILNKVQQDRCGNPEAEYPCIWVSPIQKRVSLKKLMRHLADIGISSVLVEPGPTLYRSLKKEGLVDELIVYRSKKKIHQGLKVEL